MPRKKVVEKTVGFEQSLTELNKLVEKMEKGNLGLETSLAQFERGVALIQECQKALNQAQQKVKQLTKDGKLKTYLEENDA